MIGHRQDLLQSSFAPRANLEGATIPAGFTLPSLESVQSDVRTLAKMLETGSSPVPERAVFISSKTGKATSYGPDPEHDSDSLPSPLAWNMTLPSLFKFGYFCRVEDVPTDLVKPVIWSLEMFHRVLTECTDEQLYDAGHYLRHQEAESAGRFMISNTRAKLCKHLLGPSIDRPAQAVPYLEAAIELNARMLKEGKTKVKGTPKEKRRFREKPWLYNPVLYSQYSDARTFSGHFDEETKVALERVIEACEKGEGGVLGISSSMVCLIKAKVNLVQVLKQMGNEEEGWKEHMDWAATFLRKNQKLMMPLAGVLVQMLGRSDQPVHPVLERLGGDKWLQKQVVAAIASPEGLAEHLRGKYADGAGGSQAAVDAVKDLAAGMKRATIKQEERVVTKCRQCGAREPMTKLFKCSGCRYTYYCSKECQRANWKLHREPCKEYAAARKRVASLEVTGSSAAQGERDWMRWRDLPHEGNSTALMHALGVHRDASRGRTHIVVRQLAYTPTTSSGREKDLRDRFTVVSAGVFRIADVYGDIEAALNLNRGEGREYVDGMLAELDSLAHEDEVIPILDLSIGEGFSAWLGSTATTPNGLRAYKYDPEWRKRFNKNGPPAAPLKLASGVPDAEHDA